MLLPLSIFLVGAVVDYRQTHGHLREEVLAKTESLAEHATAVLQMIRVVLARVEEHIDGRTWPEIRQSQELYGVLKSLATELPEVEAVFLVGPDGHVAVTSRGFPSPSIDMSRRDDFLAMRDDAGLYVSVPFKGDISGVVAFTVSRRLSRSDGTARDGGFDGGIGVVVRPRYFEGFFRAVLSRDEDSVAALIRTDGTVLVRYPISEEASVPASEALLAALASGRRADVFAGQRPADLASRVAAYRRIEGLPLAAVYSVESWAIYRPWLRRLAALGSFALLTGFALFWASRRALRDAESELDLGRARLEGVVRAMPIGVIVAEAPSGRVLLANDQVSAILRGPLDPTGGIDAYATLVGFHADGQRFELDEWPLARALCYGETVTEVEIDIVRGDGSRGTIAVSSAPVRDRSGTVVAGVVAFYDITARKDSQARVELLMRETLHRAKNQLAVVEGMARQTGRISTGINDFLDRFSERLQGLSLTQALLVERQWASIRLRDLLLAQMKPFGVMADERLVLDGPNVEVAPEPAQNLGLAFHELASNATRFGALSNGKGRVVVKWGASADDRFQLEWLEEGGPPIAAPPAARGFGSMVLTRIAGAAVDGTVTMEFTPSGLVWRLDGNTRYFH
ncbi:HWE histidine kinase domain-containing protein [Blastochloris viridis]|uniref:histidine kinase n=1 Tax=Blastochloris viridis TaxID=1079 RepID=A0A0S4Q5X7_BLAVI|nr:HWE histidine kinase domain-containing protein [Blastochloris viridis]CUU43087.1 Blue-light-activated histidine kinase [Blastochloris viridis]